MAKREGLALHVQHDVLHLQGERLFVDNEVGSATPLDHELTRPVAIEFGNSPEEIEEVLAVGRIEGVRETYIDEDDLRDITLRSELR